MTHTLLDPHTGLALEAIGYRKDGSPIWPILGASDDDDADGDDTDDKDGDDDGDDDTDDDDTKDKDDTDDDDSDSDTGSGGDGKAWDESRYKRDLSKKNRENKSLRERAKAAEDELKGLKRAGMDKEERLAAEAKDASDEVVKLRKENNTLRLLSEVEGLTPRLAARVEGDSYEEMLEDAKELVSELGTKTPATKKTTNASASKLKDGSESDGDDESDPDKLAEAVRSASNRRIR